MSDLGAVALACYLVVTPWTESRIILDRARETFVALDLHDQLVGHGSVGGFEAWLALYPEAGVAPVPCRDADVRMARPAE